MNKTVKQPIRTCIGCGEPKEKKELLRIVRTPEGSFHVDATGKKSGRGTYLCPKADCLEKAFRTKALNRSFREEVPREVQEELRKELGELVKG